MMLTGSAVLLLVVGTASAQTHQERSVARSNAQSGLTAFENGDHDKAIEHLTRAESVVHAPTHLLYIARSHVAAGRLLEGQEFYLTVINETLPEGASGVFVEAQDTAAIELRELMGRLSKVNIKIIGGAPAGLRITIDDVELPNIAVGVATPVNPGRHVVEATAPGKRLARAEWSVDEGEVEAISLELLDQPESSSTPAQPADENQLDWQPIAGWTGVALGGGALVLGTVTGILAISEQRKLDETCSQGVCPVGSDLDDYHLMRTLSTAGFIVGGVLTAAGVTLLLTSPSSKSQASLSTYVAFGSIGFEGKF